MSPLLIRATDRTPCLEFDYDAGQFRISGESYPEEAYAFFEAPLTALFEWMDSSSGPVHADFRLVYLNSSTAKFIVKILMKLEAASIAGRDCAVSWRHDVDDHNIRELGEEFRERVGRLPFELVESVAD
jgi:hypothetical protein